MDLTYTAENIGATVLLLNYETGLDSPYFLLELTDPCGSETKYSIFDPGGCDLNWTITIEGVSAEIYEDLDSGIVFFGENGTWSAAVYYQDSSSNVDPENATFVTNILLQIV